MPQVKIVQTSQFRWHIESETGKVIQDNIMLQNPYRAELYVKNYVSSFLNWTYVIVPLENEGKRDESS